MLVDLSIQPNYFVLLVWSLNCVERITGSIINYSCFSILQHRRFGDQWKRASAPNSLQQISLYPYDTSTIICVVAICEWLHETVPF
jgi:hypothetical protein